MTLSQKERQKMVFRNKQNRKAVNSGEQSENRPAWWFEKGKSGNPSGRPKGSISLKQWAQNYLAGLSKEEKLDFIAGMPKEVIWKMAEGNPKQDTEMEVTLPQTLVDLMRQTD